jgi:hypothetical protein
MRRVLVFTGVMMLACATLAQAQAGVEMPSGTRISISRWDDLSDAKLNPQESVALLFLMSMQRIEFYCNSDLHRYCTIEEMVKGVERGQGKKTVGLARDPADDGNYTYTIKTSGKAYQIAAIPKHAGIGGWLADIAGPMEDGEYHFNPSGPASTKDKKPFGHAFGIEGHDFVK